MPDQTKVLKKQQKPLVIFLRLYGPAKQRMQRICKRWSTDHNSVGMAGTLAEIHRLEVQAVTPTDVISAQLAEAARLGLDVERVLASAIAQQARAARQVVLNPFPHQAHD